MIQSDTCIGQVDCFEVGGSYAAELNSLFTQQPAKGSGPAGAVRLRARFWVVSPERASSRRSVNSLNLFGEEVQHLARHTGGFKLRPPHGRGQQMTVTAHRKMFPPERPQLLRTIHSTSCRNSRCLAVWEESRKVGVAATTRLSKKAWRAPVPWAAWRCWGFVSPLHCTTVI